MEGPIGALFQGENLNVTFLGGNTYLFEADRSPAAHLSSRFFFEADRLPAAHLSSRFFADSNELGESFSGNERFYKRFLSNKNSDVTWVLEDSGGGHSTVTGSITKFKSSKDSLDFYFVADSENKYSDQLTGLRLGERFQFENFTSAVTGKNSPLPLVAQKAIQEAQTFDVAWVRDYGNVTISGTNLEDLTQYGGDNRARSQYMYSGITEISATVNLGNLLNTTGLIQTFYMVGNPTQNYSYTDATKSPQAKEIDIFEANGANIAQTTLHLADDGVDRSASGATQFWYGVDLENNTGLFDLTSLAVPGGISGSELAQQQGSNYMGSLSLTDDIRLTMYFEYDVDGPDATALLRVYMKASSMDGLTTKIVFDSDYMVENPGNIAGPPLGEGLADYPNPDPSDMTSHRPYLENGMSAMDAGFVLISSYWQESGGWAPQGPNIHEFGPAGNPPYAYGWGDANPLQPYWWTKGTGNTPDLNNGPSWTLKDVTITSNGSVLLT